MNAELVFFAIEAGVRLYAAGRKAYVEATLDRPLILPLPQGPGITAAAAYKFFTNDPQGSIIAAKEENGCIRDLVAAASKGRLDADGERRLLQMYFVYLRELYPEMFSRPPSPDEPKGHELVAIMTVRQWSRGEVGDHPSALQLVAGTVVNIAVDYFAHTPGAISDKRPPGRALKAFLDAIDKIDFADAPPPEIAGDLLIAVVDSVSAQPELIGNTETEKKLVRNIATVLSKSANTYLKNVPTNDRLHGSAWLQMIARAVIKGGADTVLSDPNSVLGATDAEAGFIREVGSTIAELVIGDDKLRFRALLSGDGINTVIKSALQAAAINPDILKVGNQGLRNIVVGVAEGLAKQPNLLTNDIFPELARLVLEKSANNLDLVWPKGATDAAGHLLVTGTHELFKALAGGTGNTGWPTLTKVQIMRIAGVVFDELIENPDWLLKKEDLGGDSALSVAVRAGLESLRKQSRRLSAEAVVAAISAAVNASAMRIELLSKLPAGGKDAGKVAISAAIEAVFESAFGDDAGAGAKWIRARNCTLVAALEVALDKLARIGAAQKHIDVLRKEIGGLIDARLTVGELGKQLEEKLRLVAA